MIEVHGGTNIPTVLYYESRDRVHIGSEAKEAAFVKRRNALNEDFKIDLGNHDPALGRAKQPFRTATGDKISAGELTGEFTTQLLKHVNRWLSERNSTCSSIVVAVPLPMQDKEIDDKWLANYRSALLGKGFSKENIDFMPEPFAVFQYYKYGVKHPILAGVNK